MINLQNLDIVHFKIWDVEKYFSPDELFDFLETIGVYDDYEELHSDSYTVYEYVYYYCLYELSRYVQSFDYWFYDEEV